ncbi:MAG: class I SAM-dependent methyltransferase [Candidatus Latescibacterota bacterium]
MKKTVIHILRLLRLLEVADRLKFTLSAFSYRRANRQFREKNPALALPPPFMLYESFGKLDYTSYYCGGRESAEYIISVIGRHISLREARICEWGCGPARLLRHFPELLPGNSPALFGTDYNRRTIAWCQRNIPGIDFRENRLMPPLDFPDDFFDAIYCISVFTHLSSGVQDAWLRECLRVVKPGGIFLLTVHGDACRGALTEPEEGAYSLSGCVIRGAVTEGKRTYTAYNSPKYMREVFLNGLIVEEHIPGENRAQDIWIVRK